MLDAVLDDTRPNKSLKSGLLKQMGITKGKNKLHANYGAFPRNLQSPPGVSTQQRHTCSEILPPSGQAWGFHAVHNRSRALLLPLRAKYKQRKEVDFNRPLAPRSGFHKSPDWSGRSCSLPLPSAGARSAEQTQTQGSGL